MTLKFRQKPDPAKKFHQNYYDHLLFLKSKTLDKKHQLEQCKGPERGAFLGRQIWENNNMFVPLRDMHDFTDDVGGVFVMPWILKGFAIYNIALAIYESVLALIIKTGLKKSDGQDHLAMAGNYLKTGVAVAALAIASFFNALISIFTRPIVTMISGWKPQDENRFAVEEPAAGDPIPAPAL